MNRQFSVYLDLIRFCAAALVFISHVPSFAGNWFWQLAGWGHEAVVVFFVLSGFVIAYVVFDKKETAHDYAASRLARIYSVALPALVLTLILYYLGVQIDPSAFSLASERLQDPIRTVISALLFVNQSWVALPLFSNLPYWSMGYEVLYYVFFGVLIYGKGAFKYVGLILVLMIMGPSIILYLPIWLLGVLSYKYITKHKLTLNIAVFLYIISIIGVSVFSLDLLQIPIDQWAKNLIGENFFSLLLEPADKFASDYILAIFVAMHIISSYFIFAVYKPFSNQLSNVIKHCAAHTFSLYLFHMPMLFFVAALLPYEHFHTINMVVCWLGVPIVIWLLSRITEQKKYMYKAFFKRHLSRL